MSAYNSDDDQPRGEDVDLSTIRVDGDYERAVAPYTKITPPVPQSAIVLRRLNNTIISAVMDLRGCPEEQHVQEETFQITSRDGTRLALHRFTPCQHPKDHNGPNSHKNPNSANDNSPNDSNSPNDNSPNGPDDNNPDSRNSSNRNNNPNSRNANANNSPSPSPTGTPAPAPPQPAVLYLHGGGLVSGSVTLFRKDITRYAQHSNTSIFALAYRLAPEHPYPAAVEDAYAALAWMRDRAGELHIDAGRIGIMGVSAGGGLAAAVALMARDEEDGPRVKRLILLSPMLDDRTRLPPGDLYRGFLTWTERKNALGWAAYLWGDTGDRQEDYADGHRAGSGGGEIGRYAVPARVDDLRGLPSTYIEVGGLDLFRSECLEFADRLGKAHVEVELHLYPGVPHAWEWVSLEAPVTRRAMENRLRVLGEL